MITCDYCKREVSRLDHRIHPDGRDLHPACFDRVVRMSNINWLIMDYYQRCTEHGEILSFADFMELWCGANQVSLEEVAKPSADDPPKPLPFRPK